MTRTKSRLQLCRSLSTGAETEKFFPLFNYVDIEISVVNARDSSKGRRDDAQLLLSFFTVPRGLIELCRWLFLLHRTSQPIFFLLFFSRFFFAGSSYRRRVVVRRHILRMKCVTNTLHTHSMVNDSRIIQTAIGIAEFWISNLDFLLRWLRSFDIRHIELMQRATQQQSIWRQSPQCAKNLMVLNSLNRTIVYLNCGFAAGCCEMINILIFYFMYIKICQVSLHNV